MRSKCMKNIDINLHGEEINLQMEKCLSKCERITKYFEKKPIQEKYSVYGLEKFVQEIYENFLIPVYNALSHNNMNINKKLFNNLMGHIGFYESIIDKQKQLNTGVAHAINSCTIGDSTGNFNSWHPIEPQNDRKVYPRNPSIEHSFHDFTQSRSWDMRDSLGDPSGNQATHIQEIKINEKGEQN